MSLAWEEHDGSYDMRVLAGGQVVLLLHVYNRRSDVEDEWNWTLFPNNHTPAIAHDNLETEDRFGPSLLEAQRDACAAAARHLEEMATELRGHIAALDHPSPVLARRHRVVSVRETRGS